MISKLKQARILQGKSQYYIEKETKIHQTLISLFERGIRKPNPKQRKLLAKSLGIPENELFSNSE